MKRAKIFVSLLLCWLASSAMLCGQEYFDSKTNHRPTKLTMHQLQVDLSISTFSFKSFSLSNYNSARDAADSLNYALDYSHYFLTGVGFKAAIVNKDGYGNGISLLGIARAFLRDTNEYLLHFGVGLLLHKTSTIHDSFKPTISWFFQVGNKMDSFLRLDVDGFFLFPAAPGYLLSDNNRFHIEAQLRMSSIGFYGDLFVSAREEENSDPSLQYVTVDFRIGLALFSSYHWRLLFFTRVKQKGQYRFLSTASGHTKYLDEYREAISFGIDYSGQYHDIDGYARSYNWGVELCPQQKMETDAMGTVWESKELEVAFFWKGSFSF